MVYLDEEEKSRAKMCVANITDKLQAIDTELNTREKPYKTYLKEKMDSINWDIKVLNNMINKGDD